MAALPFDSDLVVRAQHGDVEAFERIARTVTPLLTGYFRQRISGSMADVDDLVQNTLIRLHTGLPDLNDPARLKGFLMKAALFEVQDFYRGRYTGKEMLFDPAMLPEGASEESTAALRVDLDRALETLTPHARRILELRELGYRYNEIAEDMDTTEAAVKMQVKRAFARLREVLAVVMLGLGLGA